MQRLAIRQLINCLAEATEPFSDSSAGHTEFLVSRILLLNNRFSFQYLQCLSEQSIRPLEPQRRIGSPVNGEDTVDSLAAGFGLGVAFGVCLFK